jgi:hypothetical protein
MSSNTQIRTRVEERSRAVAEDVLFVERVLGPGGTALLRETLAGSPLVEQLGWRQRGEHAYETEVEGTSVVLRLGSSAGSVAKVEYARDEWLPRGRRAELMAEHRRAAGRRVNALLAIAMQRKIEQHLRTYTSARVRVAEATRATITERQLLRVGAHCGPC